MSLLEVALDCIARGWFVFPCQPRGKKPLTSDGFKAATTDAMRVRLWWGRWPDANVGIATGASGLTVLDIDAGIETGDDLESYCASRGLPVTFAVRTGRRPGFGVQLYFDGEGVQSIPWKDTDGLDGRIRRDVAVSGDIRGATGYVMAAGSIHPSGAAYEVLIAEPIAVVTEVILSL